MDVENNSENGNLNHLREKMLNYLAARNDVNFKSQQRGDPELTFSEKRNIAESILNNSFSLFLSRFGNYILEDHLFYFANPPSEQKYEVDFYLKKLRKTGCKPVTKVQIKNRRFEAMKRLLSEGEYFSVPEMRKRNPLLYDQLLGRFLIQKEHIESGSQQTIVNILLEQIEEDRVDALKCTQIEAENRMIEGLSSDDEDECSSLNNDVVTGKNLFLPKENINSSNKLWGEHTSYKKKSTTIGKLRWRRDNENNLTRGGENMESQLCNEEKGLLINEFTSAMFTSFLQGRDDYDYSEIDNNPEYDDISQCDIDEQEKYFDAESPEDHKSMLVDSEDELDKFMKNINDQSLVDDFDKTFKNIYCS